MKTCFICLIGLFVLAINGCYPHKNRPELEEAFQYHQESLKTRKSISEMLRDHESKTNSPLPAHFQSLKDELEEWDENFVEVPGYGHVHDHDHDHDHHHLPAPDLTDAEHRDLQKHLLEEIRSLRKKTDHLLKE
ncbi:hypothetical protein [Negadavirga shengliensis]|uniref:Lipoprotein n=1 Tax=Negadavirga shengliensis TaxID=1389218 RepID=A0ABV9T518_9BACT